MGDQRVVRFDQFHLFEASARFTAKGKPNRTLDVAQAQRAAIVPTGERLGVLGEDTLRASAVDTPQHRA